MNPGTKLGPYEILASLGAGGMGEVYRARDTRLGRDVAIKVLPTHIVPSREFHQRFEREARVISSLTHPNICTLHDVGEHDGNHYLVMELLDGETLAARLTRGPLPLDQVVKTGAEIAAALDNAHRAGIVHRDLKPGNVILTRSGAKLLDFGLARSTVEVSGPESVPPDVTVTEPLTGKGAIIGTVQYMSPEQLEGQDADVRSDIFAFGTVLYEMVTGRRAFEGESRASLIASIMTTQPLSISELQPMTPPALDYLVRTCLAKNPDERIQTAHDAKLQLCWISEGGSQVGAPAIVQRSSRNRMWMAWACTGLACIVAVVALAGRRERSPAPSAPSLQAELPPPGLAYAYRAGPPALSPGGDQVVFVVGEEDRQSIWLRDLHRATLRQLEGTAGGHYPFWAPDGRSIGFFDGQYLKRLDIAGGLADIICPAPGGGCGGTWNRADVIVFAASRRLGGGLLSVPASGGTPQRVTTIDKTTNEFTHRNPCFLPDGRRFLFTTRRGIGGVNGVAIGSLDGGSPRRVLEVDSNAVFVEPDVVLFWRDGAVHAQRFDGRDMTGPSAVVARQVRYEPMETVGLFAASANGTLVFHPGQDPTARSELVLLDRSGQRVGTVGPPGNYYSPRFSHDGRLVAVDSSGIQNNGDIWIFGVDSPVAIRVTSDPADESRPIWSPNDDRIIYLSGRDGPDNLHAKDLSDLAVEHPVLLDDLYLVPTDWSPDGAYLAFNSKITDSRDAGARRLLSLADGTSRPLSDSPFRQVNVESSPSGKWIAYESAETGQDEVFVESFPEPTVRHQVSVGGGFGPKWRSAGRELFYRTDDHIMLVTFTDPDDPTPTRAEVLCPIDSRILEGADFDVTADGQLILVNTPIKNDDRTPMCLRTNWMTAIGDR